MITLFTTPKTFLGHSGVIQRNALESWTLLHPDVEVILFGDEAGAAEVAAELGIRHVPEVERLGEGPKILRSFFDCAQRTARHELMCYANCDIIFLEDFLEAVRAARTKYDRFLMVGRRWDTEIDEPLAFESDDWKWGVKSQAKQTGRQCNGDWIDYFVFPRGFYLEKLPEFVIGRVAWDHWLVWKARSAGLPVIDASETVIAVHQNHDYSYHPAGREGVWSDELARRNEKLAGGRWHLCSIEDATHLLGPGGVRKNPQRKRQAMRRSLKNLRESLWYGALDWTRPMRHVLGLRKLPTTQTTSAARGEAMAVRAHQAEGR